MAGEKSVDPLRQVTLFDIACSCTETEMCEACRKRRDRIARQYRHDFGQTGVSLLDIGSDVPGGGAA